MSEKPVRTDLAVAPLPQPVVPPVSQAAPPAAPAPGSAARPAARPTPRPAPRPPRVSRWPAPAVPAGPRALAAPVAAGILAAVLVPLGRPGLGWALAALAVGAVTVLSVWRAGLTRRRRIEALAWGLVAVVLLGVGAVRAAEWLFAICLFAAAGATVLAVTGGRTIRGLALGALLVPVAAGRGAGYARRGVAGLGQRVRPTARLVPTVAVTGLVLLVFGALFASADATFSRLLGRAVPDIAGGTVLRWVVLFTAGGLLTLAASYLLLAPPTVDRNGSGATRSGVRLLEWAVPVGALVALFASFVLVQIAVLFGGAAYVLDPDGPTYAQHARGGFWQLLTVTALTLLVIGIAARLAPRRTATERWCLRGLLGGLALLTLVIVASALFRMHTYQEAYGFTRLRVLVSVVELWLGLVFVLVLVAGIRLRAHWLPRAVVASAVAAVLALAVLNPDRLIAERNLDRWADGHQLDVAYLAGLSADATPVLVCLPEPERSRALTPSTRRALADEPDDWRSANLARARAERLLASGAACPAGQVRTG